MKPEATTRVLAMALLLAAATAVAAQDVVTPDDPRYVEKTTEEQLRMALAEGPREKAALCLAFARERVREMEALAARHRFRHMEGLVRSWETLTFEGASKAAEQGSAERYDMRATLEALERHQREFARRFRTLASAGMEPEPARLLNEAALRAEEGAGETVRALERERVRVQERTEMMERARQQLRMMLRGGGASPDRAEALGDALIERVRNHERVRVRLLAETCIALGANADPAAAAAVGAAANGAADGGCAEETVDAMVRALLRARAAHGEMERLLNRVRSLARSGDGQAQALANGGGETAVLALERGMHARAVEAMLRHGEGWVREGVPGRLLFEAMRGGIENFEAGDPARFENELQRSLRAVDEIRETLRERVAQHRERFGAGRDTVPGEPRRPGRKSGE